MRLECYCTRGGNYARNGGEGWARPSFASGPSEFKRERERERESLLQTSGRRDVMMMERRKRRSRDFFFWIPKETIREYDVQLLVVEEVYNVLIIYSWQE